MKPGFLAISLLLCAYVNAQSTRRIPALFMGRDVTLSIPKIDSFRLFPEGPATVCIEGPPDRQCYTAPEDFGRDPTVELVQVEKGKPALLFSAGGGGVGGYSIIFVLLRPGEEGFLVNLFFIYPTVSDQSQHAVWTEPRISAAPLFVAADWVPGPDEVRASPHRFIISVYALGHTPLVDDHAYFLYDQYMTVRQYEWDETNNILNAEKREILARLKRIPRNR